MSTSNDYDDIVLNSTKDQLWLRRAKVQMPRHLKKRCTGWPAELFQTLLLRFELLRAGKKACFHFFFPADFAVPTEPEKLDVDWK